MSALKHQIFVEYMNTFGQSASIVPGFEKLVASSVDFDIEFSIKFKNKNMYPFRTNLWFHDNYVKNINNAFNLFKEASSENFSINYSEFKKYFDRSFDLKKLKQFIVGMDHREDKKDSRLKIWFIIKDYPEKQNLVVSSAKKDFKDIERFVIHDELLFGFDFRYDGSTRMKVYPDFRDDELKDPLRREVLRKNFSEKVNQFIDNSRWLHISADDSGRKILHFHPKNWDYFLAHIDNDMLKAYHIQLYSSPVQIKDSVLSLYEDEIDSEKISDYNYYILL